MQSRRRADGIDDRLDNLRIKLPNDLRRLQHVLSEAELGVGSLLTVHGILPCNRIEPLVVCNERCYWHLARFPRLRTTGGLSGFRSLRGERHVLRQFTDQWLNVLQKRLCDIKTI